MGIVTWQSNNNIVLKEIIDTRESTRSILENKICEALIGQIVSYFLDEINKKSKRSIYRFIDYQKMIEEVINRKIKMMTFVH